MKTLTMKKNVSPQIRLMAAGIAALFSSTVSAQVSPQIPNVNTGRSGLLINALPNPPAPNQKPDATARDVEIGNPRAAIRGLGQKYEMIRISGFESEVPDDKEGYDFVSKFFPMQITGDKWEDISHQIFHHYTDRGIMPRVDLVMKPDKSAVVDITLLHIHKITVENPGLRDEEVVELKNQLSEYVKEGEIIDLKKLKNFLSTVDYRGTESVTTKFLEITDEGVELKMTVEPRPIPAFDRWSVGMDNYGTPGFGWKGLDRERLTATYSAPLFSSGDNLGVGLVASRGLKNISGRYDFPLPGTLPLRGDVWLSYLKYNATIDSVRERGNATLGGADLKTAQFFWSGAKVEYGAGYEFKRTSDEVIPIDTTRKKINNFHLRANVSDFFNKRVSAFSDLTIGNLSLSGKYAPLQDALLAKTSGSFQKLNLGVEAIQPVTDRTYFTASAKGQLSSKNLDSLEKMYFGGNDGVRAYDNNITGDQGALVRLNYFYQIPDLPTQARVGGLIDYAFGQHSKKPWDGQFTDTSNTFKLTAVGVQADVTFWKMTVNASLARPITTSDEDRQQKWRAWVGIKATF